jgi:hypothetical protein
VFFLENDGFKRGETAMFDQHYSYLFEVSQANKAEELRRIANGPSWVEGVAGLVWLPLRPALRLLGQGLQVTGAVLVRHTQKVDSSPVPDMTIPADLDRQIG